ncbi:MAG: tetratricopeptide repeat protein [Proteobacteria bacterium]|nr:tetratricopeptide repeat protein [Pseudomonadota bacterium]
MGIRSALGAVVFGVILAGSAHAGPKEDIAAKTKDALDAYDLMDYPAAKKSLDQALAIAKKSRLEKDPLVAKVYVAVGIAAHANGDLDGAKLAFLSAVQIDAKIQIDAAYKSPELVKLLDEARSEAAGGGTTPEPVVGSDVVDCASVKGLQHTILDAGKIGVAQPIEAYLGSEIAAVKVSLMYRAEGATDFTEVKMSRQGSCKYNGAIPSSAMKGTLVHYFVAAYDNNNKPIASASRGSSGSPNIMELSAAPTGVAKPDVEDPIKGGGGGGTTGGEIGGGVIAGGKPAKVMLGVAVGTGFGYVSGITEGNNDVKNPGIANSLLVITPELAFAASPQLTIGIAARLGIPLGANIDNHATLAPAVVARVRYTLSDSGEGVRLMGQVGGGIIRNTLKVDNEMPGMDTDIVAQGPLLIGAGLGYMKRLGSSLQFVADLSALAGIAVVDKLGSAPALNSGVTADLSLGIVVGF